MIRSIPSFLHEQSSPETRIYLRHPIRSIQPPDPHSWGTMTNAEGLRPSARPILRHSCGSRNPDVGWAVPTSRHPPGSGWRSVRGCLQLPWSPTLGGLSIVQSGFAPLHAPCSMLSSNVVRSLGHRLSPVNQRYVTLISLDTPRLRYVVHGGHIGSQYACISVQPN